MTMRNVKCTIKTKQNNHTNKQSNKGKTTQKQIPKENTHFSIYFPQNRFRRDSATQENCTESTQITATDALTQQDNEQGLYLVDAI